MRKKFDYKQLALLEQLSDITSFVAGPICKYQDVFGRFVPKTNHKMGEITAILRKLGFKAYIASDTVYSQEDEEWLSIRYITFRDGHSEKTLEVMKLMLSYNLDMEWSSRFDPLRETPTVKSRVYMYDSLDHRRIFI